LEGVAAGSVSVKTGSVSDKVTADVETEMTLYARHTALVEEERRRTRVSCHCKVIQFQTALPVFPAMRIVV
jgi:hypothetical protein